MPGWMQTVYKTYFMGLPIKRVFIFPINSKGDLWGKYIDSAHDIPYDAVSLKQFLKEMQEGKRDSLGRK